MLPPAFGRLELQALHAPAKQGDPAPPALVATHVELEGIETLDAATAILPPAQAAAPERHGLIQQPQAPRLARMPRGGHRRLAGLQIGTPDPGQGTEDEERQQGVE